MPRPVPATPRHPVADQNGGRAGTRRALPVDGDAAGRVARLAWPVIGEQLLLTLVGVVDIAMVGRLGAVAVAGVGSATQLIQLAVSSMGALSVGTTVLVARATGARRPDDAAHVTRQSLLAGLALGMALALIGVLSAEPVIRLLGPEAEVVEIGALFLRLDSLALPALVTMLVAGGALRGAGDTRTPLIASAAMNAINLALAYVLIFGKLGVPPLGVAGVALASVIARTVGAAILLGLLFRRRGLSLRSAGWSPDLGVMRRVLRIGVPTAVEQSMLSGGFLLYGALVITLGTTVYATQRITFQAISLAFMPAFGYATAATTVTGQSLGAGRPDLARAATAAALRQALFWMTLAGFLFALLAGPLLSLFSGDPEVIAIGKVALPVLALAQPFWAVGQVYAGSLRGAGDARFPMVATSAGMWLIRLPTAYLFGIVLGWGLPGVYLSSTFDAGLRALLNYLRHRSGRWQAVKV
jgi:putative MATE family efflux protein